MNQKPSDALLLLEDGTFFKGKALGKIGTSAGEICFNTGMTGYQEIYTDPSYFGQVVINTTSHIGNYGVVLDDEEESSSVKISGMVCNAFANHYYSRVTADFSLQEYFERANIVGICDVDTRQIVRHIRDAGVMNCIISSEILDPAVLALELKKVPSMDGLELSSIVSTKEAYYLGSEDAKYKVAVLDFGVKKSILNNFVERDCYCKVFNAKTSFEEIAAFNPDGYFLSNGPGDPSAMPYAVETIKQVIETNKPVFGICLVPPIIGFGKWNRNLQDEKWSPWLESSCKNLRTGLCEITSQNHGFAVKPDQVESVENIELTHVNLNDKTIEGIRRKDKPAFSVQYHPEASPGPHDSRYLFDDFVKMLG